MDLLPHEFAARRAGLEREILENPADSASHRILADLHEGRQGPGDLEHAARLHAHADLLDSTGDWSRASRELPSRLHPEHARVITDDFSKEHGRSGWISWDHRGRNYMVSPLAGDGTDYRAPPVSHYSAYEESDPLSLGPGGGVSVTSNRITHNPSLRDLRNVLASRGLGDAKIYDHEGRAVPAGHEDPRDFFSTVPK